MQATSWKWGFLGAMSAYVAMVVAGVSVRNTIGPGPSAAMWGVALGTIGAAIGSMALVITAGRRATELERYLFTESTSVAFFVTMLSALTYGLLESWLELPRLSAWATWSVGMGSWALLSLVMKRRIS